MNWGYVISPIFPLFFSVLCIKFDGAVFRFCERNCISRRDCTRVEEENGIQIHITESKTVEVIRSHNQKKLYLHFCTWALKDLRVSGWLGNAEKKKISHKVWLGNKTSTYAKGIWSRYLFLFNGLLGFWTLPKCSSRSAECIGAKKLLQNQKMHRKHGGITWLSAVKVS